MKFDAVKVFSATLMRDRAQLGELVTDWLTRNRVQVVDILVRQSSDDSYHCVSVVLFYRA